MEKNIFMELLAAREFKAIRSILNVMNAVDIASLLSEFEEKELAQAFRLIPKAKAAEVFANMSNVTQSCLIDAFTETELKEIIDDMFMDDTVDLLEDLPANVVTRILSNINPQKRAQINILLDYPQDSAGSIMTTEYVSLKRTMTVKQAMAHIKEVGIHKETIYTCYVLEARRLVGIVTAKDLMVADDDKTIEELMRTEIIFVHTGDDQEQVGQLFSKYDLLALPVLDTDECMVGIVTVDDALDVVVDEVHDDLFIRFLHPAYPVSIRSTADSHDILAPQVGDTRALGSDDGQRFCHILASHAGDVVPVKNDFSGITPVQTGYGAEQR